LSLRHEGTFESVVDGQPGPKVSGEGKHPELLTNFYNVMRSRQTSDLLAPLEYGRTAAGLCHLANISYRLGRSVEFDPAKETFPHDEQATAMLSRAVYRSGFELPDKV
ncbi:MAG TPA: hypothetical protein VMF30_02855, partial [Pirellulales bacterium]|nr:hypothetical protein [Pirellulales bacterium]